MAGEQVGGVTIDVAGAVVNPGVYTLPIGSRIDDAIASAGGLRRDAAEDVLAKSLNRAARLSDGMKIYIPSKETVESGTSYNSVVQRPEQTSHNAGVLTEAGSTISINSASQTELETLSGVGPVTAAKIISGRPYGSIDELRTKQVVGEKLFEKIRAQLSL